jgi:hypothetical protein
MGTELPEKEHQKHHKPKMPKINAEVITHWLHPPILGMTIHGLHRILGIETLGILYLTPTLQRNSNDDVTISINLLGTSGARHNSLFQAVLQNQVPSMCPNCGGLPFRPQLRCKATLHQCCAQQSLPSLQPSTILGGKRNRTRSNPPRLEDGETSKVGG